MIDVIVTGAAGRMGREVVGAVSHEDDMRVVAAVDPNAEGTILELGSRGFVEVTGDLDAALAAGEGNPRVLVDFTTPDTAAANVRTALAAGVDCVVGTTGVGEDEWRAIEAGTGDDVCLFVAPNFAVGAVLMMKMAEQVAPYMPHVEITELHHDRKLDAPSGTAMRTARMIADARGAAPNVPGRDTEVAEGARGAVVDGVHVHSVRLPGLVAHQEVVFGGQGQTLTIRHDSIDRTSFMPGVVLAVRKMPECSGFIVGLDGLMGL